VIEKKKQQLKELDALAQSIFYEMFGDPITNEKGWEVKKLGEISKVIGGYAFKSNHFIENGIPVLRIGNINSGQLKTTSIVFYQENNSLIKYVVYPGDLVISLTGTVGKDDYGNVCILDNTYPKYYLNQRNAKIELSEVIHTEYVRFFLKDKGIKNKLTGVNRGVRQGNISNKDIEGLQIYLPPFPLQQAFASKIEAIEKQKELIKQSIKEVETLFNSRMDYYFN
jgi:type I restriction enzyme S subunit